MSLIEIGEQSRTNPLDVVERLAATNDWSFERAGEDEITILVRGKWTDYQVSFTWMFDIEALHLACAFELKVPDHSRAEDGIVMYRHALVLAGGLTASRLQCEALLSAALDASERYYPAYQFVVWAGKTAREALEAAVFETAGEA